MKLSHLPVLLLGALLSLAAPASIRAAAEADAAAGRAVVKKNADAVVTIEMVAVVRGTGRGGSGTTDQKVEVNGTVISSTGLTVASLATIDPRTASGRGGTSDTEFKEVKLRLADNSEIAATVVLKDAELDLAFIAPMDAGREFPFVNLADTVEPAVLGTYYDISRLSKELQRTPVVQATTIVGMIEKPRRLILVDTSTISCPVFDASGKVLGITLVYFANNRALRFIVVPAADIAEMSKQAQAARARVGPLPMP